MSAQIGFIQCCLQEPPACWKSDLCPQTEVPPSTVASTCVGCPVSSWRPCTGDSTTSLWEPQSGPRSRSGTTRWDTETDAGLVRAGRLKRSSIIQLTCWCSRLCCHSRPSRRRTPAKINNSHTRAGTDQTVSEQRQQLEAPAGEGGWQANEARLTVVTAGVTAGVTWLQMQ